MQEFQERGGHLPELEAHNYGGVQPEERHEHGGNYQHEHQASHHHYPASTLFHHALFTVQEPPGYEERPFESEDEEEVEVEMGGSKDEEEEVELDMGGIRGGVRRELLHVAQCSESLSDEGFFGVGLLIRRSMEVLEGFQGGQDPPHPIVYTGG